MEAAHIGWSKQLHSSLKEGGLWAVPRTGLIFRREGDSMVLVQRLPGFADKDQWAEYDAIKAHFEAAGIAVSKA